MRGLTLIQPWPWAICHAGKRVENRSWPPPKRIIGERLALHRGVTFDTGSAAWLRENVGGEVPAVAAPAGVVAVVTVLGFCREDDVPANQRVYAFGPWCWLLDDVQVLAEVVPCKGMLGLWTLPADVERLVRKQLEAA